MIFNFVRCSQICLDFTGCFRYLVKFTWNFLIFFWCFDRIARKYSVFYDILSAFEDDILFLRYFSQVIRNSLEICYFLLIHFNGKFSNVYEYSAKFRVSVFTPHSSLKFAIFTKFPFSTKNNNRNYDSFFFIVDMICIRSHQLFQISRNCGHTINP